MTVSIYRWLCMFCKYAWDAPELSACPKCEGADVLKWKRRYGRG